MGQHFRRLLYAGAAELLGCLLAVCEGIHRQTLLTHCFLSSHVSSTNIAPVATTGGGGALNWRGFAWQDAFVHAYSKEAGLREALRVTKPGGFLVLCDLHCGDGPDVSAEELHTFAETNMVRPRVARMHANMVRACGVQGRSKGGARRRGCPSMLPCLFGAGYHLARAEADGAREEQVADWLTPEEMVVAAKKAGWADAHFVDLTPDIRLSFQVSCLPAPASSAPCHLLSLPLPVLRLRCYLRPSPPHTP